MSNSVKTLLTRFSVGVLVIGTVLLAPVALAAPQEPQTVVEQVTKELFVVAKASSAPDAKEDVYFGEVEKILDEVVDFRFIARAVMGKEAFGKASSEQKAKFADAFKSGLVKSYAKGIAGYADSDIKVVGAKVSPKDPTRAVVRQEVSYEGNVHQLSYTMRLQGEDWRVINVVLNGVNLGQSFTSQFSAAMRKEKGDIDNVIAGWLAES